MDWFYDSKNPEENTEKSLQEAVNRIAAWWGLTNHEFSPTYGTKDGAAGSTFIGYPALKDTIIIDPKSDLEKTVFHEMAHIALEPALTTIKTLTDPYLPDSVVEGIDGLVHDIFEEFIQKMDRAVDMVRKYDR